MGRRILAEGSVLLDPLPSQAQVYAGRLATAYGQCGLEPELLVGSNRRISVEDPQLAEITLFDAPRGYHLFNRAGIALRQLGGAPFGYRPGLLEAVRGTVVGRERVLDGFGRIYAIPNLGAVERGHFNRYGKSFNIKTKERIDVFHSPRPAPLRVAGAANIYTIASLEPQLPGEPTARNTKYVSDLIAHLGRSADHIATVSETSRRQIIAATAIEESRITNLYHPVPVPPPATVPAVSDMLRRYFGLEYGGYYLYAGTIDSRKNIRRLIESFTSADVKRPLILTGAINWLAKADHEMISDERLTSYMASGATYERHSSVQYLGPLPRQQHFDLMRGARTFLYPVLDDDFPLPVAEALRLGTPVMTSDREALREIAGEAAIYADATSVQSIAQAIRVIDADDDLLGELSAKGRCRGELYSESEFDSRLTALLRKFV